MRLITSKLVFFLTLFAGSHSLMAQLSGVINTYTKVTGVDYLCSFITVASPAGFSAGDKVLLIQMQGAEISTAQDANFGNITNIADAGNYEFAIIDHFVGNDVYLSKNLLRTYTPAGSVQLISVPQYGDVTVSGELTAKTWDGETGGVLIFESSGTVTLNADINLNEKGFRGGEKSPDGGNCNTISAATYYTSYPTVHAGQKGEGISNFIPSRESARGKNSTGGGGGNSHNTGGGGGGNYGSGGRGGDRIGTGCPVGFNGYGIGALGLLITYYNTTAQKIFMGGGGGGGQVNNALSFDAGDGGGIVMIKANQIEGNGHTIYSIGGSVDYYAFDNGDGNSGGGAGGTVLLDVPVLASTLNVDVRGGTGGNTFYPARDFGPGGGGGGGVVWVSSTSVPAQLSTIVTGGASGISVGSGSAFGAAAGGNGAVLTELAMPSGSTNSPCALPVELLSYTAKARGKHTVHLNWSTGSETNNHYFTLERSNDGIYFYPLARITGKGNTKQRSSYSYVDEVTVYEVLYYRLSQTDLDGTTTQLGIRKVNAEEQENIIESVYPNPFSEQLFIKIPNPKKDQVKEIVLINVLGEQINTVVSEEEHLFLISTTSLPKGLYTLRVLFKDRTEMLNVVKGGD